jgi:hypothetical protein
MWDLVGCDGEWGLRVPAPIGKAKPYFGVVNIGAKYVFALAGSLIVTCVGMIIPSLGELLTSRIPPPDQTRREPGIHSL